MRKSLLLLLMPVVAVLFTAAPTHAQIGLFSSEDSGSSERVWGEATRPPTDQITFVWTPALPIEETTYLIYAYCERRDGPGVFNGDHRVRFKNVQLRGMDSGNSLELSRKSRRMRNGRPINVASWHVTGRVQETFANDSAILVQGTVDVGGEVAAWDLLTCTLTIDELLALPIDSATESP